MARVSRDSAPEVVDYGPAEDRTGHFDGYTVNFTSIREDVDLAPVLKGLPGDSCQCPHWGYMIAGRLTVRYGDDEEAIEPGDAFDTLPGHVPAAQAGSEFVMFSPQEELAVSEAALKARWQRLMQGTYGSNRPTTELCAPGWRTAHAPPPACAPARHAWKLPGTTQPAAADAIAVERTEAPLASDRRSDPARRTVPSTLSTFR